METVKGAISPPSEEQGIPEENGGGVVVVCLFSSSLYNGCAAFFVWSLSTKPGSQKVIQNRNDLSNHYESDTFVFQVS